MSSPKALRAEVNARVCLLSNRGKEIASSELNERLH